LCLAQEPAYLRRRWRLAACVACPIHGVRLRDACPSCGAPFVPHRHHALLNRTCHDCGKPLLAGTMHPSSRTTIALQELLISVTTDDVAEIPQLQPAQE